MKQQILKKEDVKSKPIQEGLFQCTIEDVEKRAKKIVFTVYNWNPKNVAFDQSDNMITLRVKFDIDTQTIQQTDDQIFSYLKRTSESYEKSFKNEFSNFCSSGLKFLGKKTTMVNVGVYTYLIMEREYPVQNKSNSAREITMFDSTGVKRKLKHGNHENYQKDKIYIQVGLSVNNPTT